MKSARIKHGCHICPPYKGENSGRRKFKKKDRQRDRQIKKRTWKKEVGSGEQS